MLFYRKMHLTLSRAGLIQLLRECGPDVTLELVENQNVDVAYLNFDLGVENTDVGTSLSRAPTPSPSRGDR